MKAYLDLDLNTHIKDLTGLFGVEEISIHVKVAHLEAMKAIEEHAKVN